MTNRPNLIMGTVAHSCSACICLTWRGFRDCEWSLLYTVFCWGYSCVFQTPRHERQRTVNGSSVETLCSGHRVPVADRIEIMFLCLFKKPIQPFFLASWKVVILASCRIRAKYFCSIISRYAINSCSISLETTGLFPNFVRTAS
jgi:hypothetical protein